MSDKVSTRIILTGHPEPISCLEMFPDGERLASSSKDNTIRVWNIEDGVITKTLQEHSDWVSWIDVVDNNLLVSGSFDKTIKIWDVDNEKCVSTLTGHKQEVYCVLVLTHSHNHQFVASSSRDCTIRVWNLENSECIHILRGHSDSVNCIGELEENKLVSVSLDKTLRIWDVISGKCVKSIEMDHDKDVRSLVVLSKSKVATGSRDCTIKIWNFSKKGNKCERTISSHIHDVLTMKFYNDFLISASKDKSIKLFDPYTGKCLKAWKAHKGFIRALAVRTNGEIISAGDDLKIKVWNVKYPSVSKELRKTIVIKKQEELLEEYRKLLSEKESENRSLRESLTEKVESLRSNEKAMERIRSAKKVLMYPLVFAVPVGIFFAYYLYKRVKK